MLHSFKLKMALFSVCTSGLILLAFALLFMAMIRRAGLERIDRELHGVAQAQMRRPESPEHWARFDASLAAMFGEERPRPFLVKVIDREGHPVYTSPNWPATLSDAALKRSGFFTRRDPPDLRSPPEPLRFRQGRPSGVGPPPRLIP